jgi:ubiquinone/menaquinone biosynthesis C-methylase UbiE
MLAAARKRHRADNLEFVEAAAEDLPFPDTAFDRAVCYAVYPHFSCARTAVNELFRVLRTGGQLAVLHTVGRQELNALHGQAGAAVRSDRLPPARSAAKLLANSGFEVLHYIDTEDFYALKAEKRRD